MLGFAKAVKTLTQKNFGKADLMGKIRVHKAIEGLKNPVVFRQNFIIYCGQEILAMYSISSKRIVVRAYDETLTIPRPNLDYMDFQARRCRAAGNSLLGDWWGLVRTACDPQFDH